MTSDMSLFEAIHSLRAVRKYQPEPVEHEKLTKILRAATMAPSSGNVQPWDFVVVTDATLKAQIKELVYPAFVMMDTQGRAQPPEALKDSTGRPVTGHVVVANMERIPVLVVVCYNPARGKRFKDEWRWLEEHSGKGGSVFPAVQNMLLAANALGLGALLTMYSVLRAYDIKKLLHIPDEISVEALVCLGYRDEALGRPRRLPLQQVAHMNFWEVPYRP